MNQDTNKAVTYTPGPWYACTGQPPKSDCDDPLCTGIYVDFPDEPDGTFGQGIFHADGEFITDEQARANAVLAAAAPALAEMLKDAVARTERLVAQRGMGWLSKKERDWLHHARAALREAGVDNH